MMLRSELVVEMANKVLLGMDYHPYQNIQELRKYIFLFIYPILLMLHLFLAEVVKFCIYLRIAVKALSSSKKCTHFLMKLSF